MNKNTTLDPKISQALSNVTVVDITTKGRKSGEPRRLEIVSHPIGGKIYISGMPFENRRSWLANLDADPHFTLHVKRGVTADLPATARIITDEAERRDPRDHRQDLEAQGPRRNGQAEPPDRSKARRRQAA